MAIRDRFGNQELTSQAGPNGTIAYTYDPAGNRLTTTVTGQPQLTYGYNDDNQLKTVTGNSQTVSVSYDKDTRPSTVTLPDGITQTYGYDPASRVTGITYTSGTTTLGALNYGYDPAGNRTAEWGAYATLNLPAAFSSPVYNADNALASVNGTSYSYDTDGNLTQAGTTTYTWNARNQLTGITAARRPASATTRSAAASNPSSAAPLPTTSTTEPASSRNYPAPPRPSTTSGLFPVGRLPVGGLRRPIRLAAIPNHMAVACFPDGADVRPIRQDRRRPRRHALISGGLAKVLGRSAGTAADGGLAGMLATVTSHLNNIGALGAPENAAMIARIQGAITGGQALNIGDINFMIHELTEAQLMARGVGQDLAHELAATTHPPFANYAPEVVKQFMMPPNFNSGWGRYWGVP